ncbi:uncharacterized protein LDX57_005115 [Aspergillus melleus]|uniref:uncharacterized protein n=1 Tax=Aspergillus melleus TaxID=138277 RepID=UPI001E8DA1A7|nr:uncharacterized protein LDX57_005115 [Aspergillus melleus]KAH8427400.1 hypothetical protein LDX57_005115 [Aspergillus melleus]
MGGSPQLSERQHVEHAPFPPPHLNSQYPVSAARGNGLVDSHQVPDADRHVSRRSVPAAQNTASHPRAETDPLDLPYKSNAHPGSSGSSQDLVLQSQTQNPSDSLDHSTVQSGHSPKRPQPQPQSQPIESRNLPTIVSHEARPTQDPRDNGAQSFTTPKSPPEMLVGRKRTAMGVAKPGSPQDHYSAGQTSSGRRRSESIGSLSHGSRIAAKLSVHLRTRLSYAASKIEKSRQANNARFPMGLLTNNSRAPPTDPDTLKRMGLYPFPDESSESHQIMDMGSPDGTTVSAPDPSAPSQSHFQPEPLRASPTICSGSSTPFMPHHDRSRSHGSTPTIPRLAPPADIIPKSSNSRRRRPNPNEAYNPHRYSPFPLHRRHHSQQEFGVSKPATSSETVLVPGTPPPQPLSGAISTPYGSLSNRHIQGTAMEQDAIETLLFMSSPGHSGYYSHSQNSQPQPSLIQNSVSNSRDSTSSSRLGQESHHKDESDRSGSHGHGSNAGLESQAGDEIDRMLDQMDSDSEDEKALSRHQSDNLSTNSNQKKSTSEQDTPRGS